MKVVLLIKRKTGLTLEQFKDYYEHVHVPLVLRLFPYLSSYERNYVRHAALTFPNTESTEAEFDVITELKFGSQADLERMFAARGEEDIARQLDADEERFVDRGSGRLLVVDEYPTPAVAAH